MEKREKFEKLKEEMYNFIFESDFSYIKSNKKMLDERLENIYDL